MTTVYDAAMPTMSQRQNADLIADAMKNVDIAKVVKSYEAFQPYVPAPSAVPIVKSQISAGGNAA